jgi:hypothetical protein
MSLFAFDGINTRKQRKTETNTARFTHAYRSGEAFYYPGMGSHKDKVFILAAINGTFGLRGKALIQQAYLQLAKQVEENREEPIDLVGFGRGGALALHFANLITLKGLPILKSKQSREIELRMSETQTVERRVVYKFDFCPAPPIRFIGIWDLVTAHEIPLNMGPIPFQQGTIGYRLGIPKAIWNAYHAMALDEMNPEVQVIHLQGAEEVWFMGNHEQVGGVQTDSGLADIALQWMFRKGMQSGLSFDSEILEQLQPTSSDLPEINEDQPSPRTVCKCDLIHTSVWPDRYPAITWDSIRRVV